jgi:hypothetical protein
VRPPWTRLGCWSLQDWYLVATHITAKSSLDCYSHRAIDRLEGTVQYIHMSRYAQLINPLQNLSVVRTDYGAKVKGAARGSKLSLLTVHRAKEPYSAYHTSIFTVRFKLTLRRCTLT